VRTSREVRFAAGSCVPSGPRVIGFPAAPPLRCFHLGGRLSVRPSPGTLRLRVHSLVRRVLFGVSSASSRAGRFRPALSCQGFFPLRGTTGGVPFSVFAFRLVPSAGLPDPRGSVLRLSQPLDGLLRLRFRGLVSSRSHVQGSSVQGFLPIHSPHWLVASRCPLALDGDVLPGCPGAVRLRPHFEALLRGSMRSSGGVFGPSRGRSPLRLCPPSGLFRCCLGPGSPGHPLVAFPLRPSSPRCRDFARRVGRLQRLAGCTVDAVVSAGILLFKVCGLPRSELPDEALATTGAGRSPR
jgi:hypothetical protein